jgi:hypothetical protein
LIGREQGASLAELRQVSGWQAHSVRGFISTAQAIGASTCCGGAGKCACHDTPYLRWPRCTGELSRWDLPVEKARALHALQNRWTRH